ncbi:hypothetical protein FSP39_018545 [Pinctada imbricata]|uniref:Nuclear protein MDM1 n=1 Tax=Pinctada imbricata TaxID=66713 RepID=A0AA88YE13_PINIB|nr:hypothetical protein FSP39_018545 [Pinctada imbricata]
MRSPYEEQNETDQGKVTSPKEAREEEQREAPVSSDVQNSEGKESIDGTESHEKMQQKQGPKDDVSLLAHEGSDEEPGKPDTEVDFHVDVLRRGGKQPSQRRQQAWEEEEDVGSELTPVSQVSQDDEGDGRIPTPQLKQSVSAARRHHFDRTTPVVGGSLLSSPPNSKPKRSGKRQVRPNVSRSWCVPADTLADDGSTITSTQSYSPLAGQSIGKTYNVRHGTLSATPTFGSPSKDTHFLRDDDASVDRPLQTTFVDTPIKSIPVISDSSEQVVSQAKPSKPRKFDLGPTIPEGVGQTYNKPISFGIDGGLPVPRTDPDDDVLSISARSVASSCSLASEVYERAQKRTQEFWGKDGIASR